MFSIKEKLMWYSGLENKRLWQLFNEISRIPRGSGNEEGIRNFLISWADKNGIDAVTDSIGNVVLKAPATKGLEKLPSLALQGHMDMVCVKKETSSHDFTKDPIAITTDGELIRAKGTSLGGDNGIAIALSLSTSFQTRLSNMVRLRRYSQFPKRPEWTVHSTSIRKSSHQEG